MDRRLLGAILFGAGIYGGQWVIWVLGLATPPAHTFPAIFTYAAFIAWGGLVAWSALRSAQPWRAVGISFGLFLVLTAAARVPSLGSPDGWRSLGITLLQAAVKGGLGCYGLAFGLGISDRKAPADLLGPILTLALTILGAVSLSLAEGANARFWLDSTGPRAAVGVLVFATVLHRFERSRPGVRAVGERVALGALFSVGLAGVRSDWDGVSIVLSTVGYGMLAATAELLAHRIAPR